ncbi:MAG: DUF3737 family protein [Clostridia bacterium]|nr:DUF3737 family protein [Clostridia bacterium]
MKHILNQTFDAERALYGLTDAEVEHCRFEGAADGESAFKEAHEIAVRDCDFYLRYPFWHTVRAELSEVRMYETCRAALWYAQDIAIDRSRLFGIKALRECSNISLRTTEVSSAEFGWFCKDVTIEDSSLSGEYLFMHSEGLTLRNVSLKGKYSFQYCKNVEIFDSFLDTKDAFWESENVTVYNSTVKGEYLAWYAKDLRLVNCKIIGTQPLCYAKGVTLENCTMEACDLAFEYSLVSADVHSHIDSVKNPLAESRIVADSIGEIILDENRRDGGRAEILVRT